MKLGRALIVFVVIVLAACAGVRSGLEPPIVHLADLRLRDAQLFEQRYTLVLRIENPNPRDLPIWGMAYKVALNNVELGRGASRQSVRIPAYGEALVDLDLASNVFSLIGRVRDIAAGEAEHIRFSISGHVSVDDQPQTLPFSFQGQLGDSRL